MSVKGAAAVASLLPAALRGDEEAWRALVDRLWPGVEHQVEHSRSLGPLRRSVDDRREVVARVFERLRRDEQRALRLFADWQRRHPDKDFGDWLAIVVANVARDFVAHRLAAPPEVDRLIETLSDSVDGKRHPGVRPAITRSVAAQELMARARARLPPEQLEPLLAWLRGHDFVEIAEMHGLARPRDAQARVRAALARLRYAVRA